MSPAIAGLLSFSCISFLIGLGFQVSGYTNLPLAIALWLLSVVLAVIAATFWIRNWRKERQAIHEKIDEQAKIGEAIQALTPLITSGNTLLGMYGQGDKPGLPWDWMIHYGLPAMNAWYQEVGQAISKCAPDFIATWNNDGQIYLNTDQKAASIQPLEGRLSRLEAIIQELRTRTHP